MSDISKNRKTYSSYFENNELFIKTDFNISEGTCKNVKWRYGLLWN